MTKNRFSGSALPTSLSHIDESVRARKSTVASFAFGLGALGFVLIARPAPAEATRPLIRTATAIKNLQLSMPIAMKDVSDKNLLGIDLEGDARQKVLLVQAEEYIALRKGDMTSDRAQKWMKECDAVKAAEEPNPFCAYEKDRTARGSTQRSAARTRDAKRELASQLKAGHFDKAAGLEYSAVVSAISYLSDSGTLHPLGQQVVDKKECVPTSVSMGLAYKLEEHFPATETVELAKKLYKKSSSCGQDFSSAQASFRLGLIQIWQHNCAEVPELMTKVEASPEASQYHARAKYWRFYCASQVGNEAAKAAAKDSLLRENRMTFQNLAVNGEDTAAVSQVLNTKEPQVAVRSFIRQDLNPLLRAGEALIKAGSAHLAAELFDRKANEIGGLEPEVRLYTAMLLNRIGYALPKFKILSNLFQDVPRMVSMQTMRLYFPLWYFDIASAQGTQLDPLLIISLIRQESAFNKEARSIVGARGLMQVMPTTARSIASVRTKNLTDPKTNVSVGTKYLLKRLGQYGGDVELTLAAYNAGFGRVEQWKKRYPTDNKMLFLDFIPFRETREYVSSILRNYYWYVKLYAPETAPVSAEGLKIDPVGPKVSAIINANAGAAAYVSRNP